MKRTLGIFFFILFIQRNSSGQEIPFEQLALNYFAENILEQQNYDDFKLYLNPITLGVDFRFHEFPNCFDDYMKNIELSNLSFSEINVPLKIEPSWNIKIRNKTKISKRKRYIETSRYFSMFRNKIVVIVSVYEPWQCDKYFVEFDEKGNYIRHCRGGYII